MAAIGFIVRLDQEPVNKVNNKPVIDDYYGPLFLTFLLKVCLISDF